MRTAPAAGDAAAGLGHVEVTRGGGPRGGLAGGGGTLGEGAGVAAPAAGAVPPAAGAVAALGDIVERLWAGAWWPCWGGCGAAVVGAGAGAAVEAVAVPPRLRCSFSAFFCSYAALRAARSRSRFSFFDSPWDRVSRGGSDGTAAWPARGVLRTQAAATWARAASEGSGCVCCGPGACCGAGACCPCPCHACCGGCWEGPKDPGCPEGWPPPTAPAGLLWSVIESVTPASRFPVRLGGFTTAPHDGPWPGQVRLAV